MTHFIISIILNLHLLTLDLILVISGVDEYSSQKATF